MKYFIIFIYYKMKTVGSRAEVMHGTAKHTSGGLRKQHLTYNKRGKIVSKRASARSKTKKGVNSLKKKNRRSRRRSKRTSSKRKSNKRKSNKRKSGRRKSSRRKSGRRKTRHNMQRGGGYQHEYLITELGGDENGKNLITAKSMISPHDLSIMMKGLAKKNASWTKADFPLYKKERKMLLTILNDPNSINGQIWVPGSEHETVTVNTSDVGCVMGLKWKVCMHAKLKKPTPLSDIRNMAKQYLKDHPKYAILHNHGEGNCQTYASYMYEKTTKMRFPHLRAHNHIALPCSMLGQAPKEYEIDTNVSVSMDSEIEPNLHWPERGNQYVKEILIIKCGVHAVIVLKIDTNYEGVHSPPLPPRSRSDRGNAYTYAGVRAHAHAHHTGQNQSKTPPPLPPRPRLLTGESNRSDRIIISSWETQNYFSQSIESHSIEVTELIINLKLPEGDGVLKYTKTYDDEDGVYIPNLEESVCSRALCPGERQWDCQEKCKVTRRVPKAHLKIYGNGGETAITSANGKLSRFPWGAPTDDEDWDAWANDLKEFLA